MKLNVVFNASGSVCGMDKHYREEVCKMAKEECERIRNGCGNSNGTLDIFHHTYSLHR